MKIRFLTGLLVLSAVVGGTCPVSSQTSTGAAVPKDVRILTASPGGTYFQYGTRLAELIARKMGVRAVAVVSGGPYQNFPLINLGEAEIGLVTLGPARECLTGECPIAPGVKMRDVRAVFPMYETPFHLMALSPGGPKRFDDLTGKIVGVGPLEGTPGMYYPRFLQELGVAATVRYGTFDEMADALVGGKIDAVALAGGVPVPAGLRIARQHKVSPFSFARDQIAALSAKYGDIQQFTIPADSYPGQTAALETLSMWNFMVVNKALPEAFVRDLVETLLRDRAWAGLHPAAAQTRPEDVRQVRFLSLHPGAVHAFRAHRIDIPEELIPPAAGQPHPAAKQERIQR